MPGRTANPVDFWRGVALVMIFINHVPGNFYGQFTLQKLAFCDAAELFVFLAGWALSHATGGPLTPHPARSIVMRLVWRAIEIYRVQIVLTALALATLAAAAILRNNPIFLEWHNAGPAFYDTARATVGWVLLTHQLWFFDILPLYVVLMLMAPPLLLLVRWRMSVGIGVSLAIYCAALTFGMKLPTWPGESGWFFNPVAWQLLLVLGFVSSELAQARPGFARTMAGAIPSAVIATAVFTALTLAGFDPDPLAVPEPRYFFLVDKTNLSPSRIISLLVLVIAFHTAFQSVRDRLGRAGDWLCRLGRNSLAVFAVGSLLSLAAQLFRFIFGGGLTVDTITLLCGCLGMGLTAWLVETRSRSAVSAVRLSS